MQNYFSFILLAGGTGSRMNRPIAKQFLNLGGKPIIMHTLDKIELIEKIKEVIIVCHKDYENILKEYIKNYRLKKNYIIVQGGDSRQESSYKGISKATFDNIIIHEAARPFVKISGFEKLINCQEENAIYGINIPFTVVKGDDYIFGELARNELVNVQLPQKFNKALLLKAHDKANAENQIFTEDSSLLYHYTNEKINILKGESYNIKITDNIDLILGETIYKEYILENNNE